MSNRHALILILFISSLLPLTQTGKKKVSSSSLSQAYSQICNEFLHRIQLIDSHFIKSWLNLFDQGLAYQLINKVTRLQHQVENIENNAQAAAFEELRANIGMEFLRQGISFLDISWKDKLKQLLGEWTQEDCVQDSIRVLSKKSIQITQQEELLAEKIKVWITEVDWWLGVSEYHLKEQKQKMVPSRFLSAGLMQKWEGTLVEIRVLLDWLKGKGGEPMEDQEMKDLIKQAQINLKKPEQELLKLNEKLKILNEKKCTKKEDEQRERLKVNVVRIQNAIKEKKLEIERLKREASVRRQERLKMPQIGNWIQTLFRRKKQAANNFRKPQKFSLVTASKLKRKRSIDTNQQQTSREEGVPQSTHSSNQAHFMATFGLIPTQQSISTSATSEQHLKKKKKTVRKQQEEGEEEENTNMSKRASQQRQRREEQQRKRREEQQRKKREEQQRQRREEKQKQKREEEENRVIYLLQIERRRLDEEKRMREDAQRRKVELEQIRKRRQDEQKRIKEKEEKRKMELEQIRKRIEQEQLRIRREEEQRRMMQLMQKRKAEEQRRTKIEDQSKRKREEQRKRVQEQTDKHRRNEEENRRQRVAIEHSYSRQAIQSPQLLTRQPETQQTGLDGRESLGEPSKGASVYKALQTMGQSSTPTTSTATPESKEASPQMEPQFPPVILQDKLRPIIKGPVSQIAFTYCMANINAMVKMTGFSATDFTERNNKQKQQFLSVANEVNNHILILESEKGESLQEAILFYSRCMERLNLLAFVLELKTQFDQHVHKRWHWQQYLQKQVGRDLDMDLFYSNGNTRAMDLLGRGQAFYDRKKKVSKKIYSLKRAIGISLNKSITPRNKDTFNLREYQKEQCKHFSQLLSFFLASIIQELSKISRKLPQYLYDLSQFINLSSKGRSLMEKRRAQMEASKQKIKQAMEESSKQGK